MKGDQGEKKAERPIGWGPRSPQADVVEKQGSREKGSAAQTTARKLKKKLNKKLVQTRPEKNSKEKQTRPPAKLNGGSGGWKRVTHTKLKVKRHGCLQGESTATWASPKESGLGQKRTVVLL